MTTKTCGCSTASCGCCAGTIPLTPASVANRPGLSVLRYRVGTHGTFLESMRARLAATAIEAPGADGQTIESFRPLQGLTTRRDSDPAIALLDAWATIGDVLSFYQERIANEGYLRTATERRSILELARLVGYSLRPGVASTVYLAYTIDENQTVPVEIPAGARSQTIPDPDELPQAFETSDPVKARAAWNDLRPRLTQPQAITASGGVMGTDVVYLQGTSTGLKPNDPLLFEIGTVQILRFVQSVEADFVAGRTKVTLQNAASSVNAPLALGAVATPAPAAAKAGKPLTLFTTLTKALSIRPTPQHAAGAFLPRNLGDTLDTRRDSLPQLLTALKPEISTTIYPAWANIAGSDPRALRVHAFRLKASPFGFNAPLRPVTNGEGKVVAHEEWPIADPGEIRIEFDNAPSSGGEELTAIVSITHARGSQAAEFTLGDAGEFTVDGLEGVTVTAEASGKEFSPLLYRFQFKLLHTEVVIHPLEQHLQQVHIGPLGGTLDEVSVPMPGTVVHATDARRATIALARRTQQLLVSVTVLTEPHPQRVFLDNQYDQILPGERSWAVMLRTDGRAPLSSRIVFADPMARAAYGLAGKSTRLTLEKNWWLPGDSLYLSLLRGATVFAQSEELPLAQQPYDANADGELDDVGGDRIELARLYDGLQSGRWSIVSGERTDVKDANDVTVRGVRASELVMIAGVEQTQNSALPGDTVHTTIILAKPLAYTYRRTSVTIYGNVVKASHGETRSETLGSGNGSQALQAFALKQPPLTFVPSPSAAGVESTLKVYANDIEWRESDTFVGLGPAERCFVTKTDDEAKTTVIFGNGKEGARLPTGIENVRAVYRGGIGKTGNARAEQISLLQTRPLGVKSVINPLRASGGTDKETRDQARANVPLAVMALDRLVSLRDYEDFARTFAGIGKADAQRLSDGRRELVHLTIAGEDDIPIDIDSDLYRNLLVALRRYGDADLVLEVQLRELLVLVLSANVRIAPERQWIPMERVIRAALLDAFGFQKQSLGQPVFLSEVVSTIQNVDGVVYADVDAFGYVSEELVEQDKAGVPSSTPRVDVVRARFVHGALRPAQLAMFISAVPDTLILNPIQ